MDLRKLLNPPAGTEHYNDEERRRHQQMSVCPRVESGDFLTGYLVEGTNLLKAQDFESDFWPLHYDDQIRVEIDGRVSRGLAKYLKLGQLTVFHHSKVRVEISEICIADMIAPDVISVVMTCKYSGATDELTRGGIVLSTWKKRANVWRCTDWLYAPGPDCSLYGI